MIWSRTSTANIVKNLSGSGGLIGRGISDELAKRAALWSQYVPHSRRQFMKSDRRRDERIESGIGEQAKCRAEPASMRPASAIRWRHTPDLAGNHPEAAAVKRAPERDRDFAGPVPAQLEYRRFLAGKAKRGAKAR